ncbi:MAG TPA: hypothetical protein VK149_09215, partial [Sideroxyarcus sp.]|nr:hypothetical protein [Sideroxyarcus sp.]
QPLPQLKGFSTMQFSFTGRESELQHVDNLIKAKQGALYAISGRSGIGKSSLLQFRSGGSNGIAPVTPPTPPDMRFSASGG